MKWTNPVLKMNKTQKMQSAIPETPMGVCQKIGVDQ